MPIISNNPPGFDRSHDRPSNHVQQRDSLVVELIMLVSTDGETAEFGGRCDLLAGVGHGGSICARGRCGNRKTARLTLRYWLDCLGVLHGDPAPDTIDLRSVGSLWTFCVVTGPFSDRAVGGDRVSRAKIVGVLVFPRGVLVLPRSPTRSARSDPRRPDRPPGRACSSHCRCCRRSARRVDRRRPGSRSIPPHRACLWPRRR